MDELLIPHKNYEIDVFDRSLFPFYKDNNLAIYSVVQDNSIRKITDTIIKGNLIKEITSTNVMSDVAEKAKFLSASIDPYTQSMIDKGEWILKIKKDSTGFLPTLYDKSGNFAKQLSLKNKEIDICKSIESNNVGNSLSNLYLQQQMSEIIDQLEALNSTIQRVERGQLDDRIGLYLSAKQQFLEALNIENESLKQLTLANAVKSANDARFQLMQTVSSNIKLLFQTKKKTKEIDMILNNIRESMQYANESTQLCIAAYSIQNEEKAQIAILQSYQNFIDTAFLNKNGSRTNAEMLHSNWEGSDNSWLEFPQKLKSNIEIIIDERKLYLESGD